LCSWFGAAALACPGIGAVAGFPGLLSFGATPEPDAFRWKHSDRGMAGAPTPIVTILVPDYGHIV
jgi:hypothetical protein